MLLWKRYGNNKMAAMCYYGNVMATTRWRLFYIFNSTVVDTTFFFTFKMAKKYFVAIN